MSTVLKFSIAPAVEATAAPPIPKAQGWGRKYCEGAQTDPLLDLSQGVPGTAPHVDVLSSLAIAASDPLAARYGPILGEPNLRAALATELRLRYNLDQDGLKGEDVGITTGCNMAFLILLMVLCPPGTSSVLLPLPAYFNHSMSLSLQTVKPEYIPCDPNTAFRPSLSAARAILSRGPQTGSDGRMIHPRAIVLVSPNNPTGSVYSPTELRKWYDLALQYEIPLIIDETYRDFVDGAPHGLFAEPDWRSTLISLGSFSKGYRIPGHRLGSIIASPELLSRIATVCDCMQICPPRPPQIAIAPLLPSLRSDLLVHSSDLATRRALFEKTVSSAPGWRVLSSGGFFAYVEYPSAYASRGVVLGLAPESAVGSEAIGHALATQCGVVTLPGCFFMPALDDTAAWAAIDGGDVMREDRWLRFAVANVSDEVVLQLGPRLLKLNKIMGV